MWTINERKEKRMRCGHQETKKGLNCEKRGSRIQMKRQLMQGEEKEGLMVGVGSAVMLVAAPQGVGMTRTLSSSHPLSPSPAKTSNGLMNN